MFTDQTCGLRSRCVPRAGPTVALVHRGIGRSRLPRPGGQVRGSTTGRPIMAAVDLLGRRCTLRIVWELADGPLGTRALRYRCEQMSSSVLYERLSDLSAAGLIARDGAGAHMLTELGAAVGPALESLDAWARRWSKALALREQNVP